QSSQLRGVIHMPWIRTTVCASALMSASPVVMLTPGAVIAHAGVACERRGKASGDGSPDARPARVLRPLRVSRRCASRVGAAGDEPVVPPEAGHDVRVRR